MFIRSVFFSLIISAYIVSEDDIPKAPLLASIESEPSGIIDGCVNVISGCYFEHDVDLVCPGPESLKVERMLVNNNNAKISSEARAWHFNDMQFVSLDDFDNRYRVNYYGALGDRLDFHFTSKKPRGEGHNIDTSLLKHGYMNTSKGVMGAQTNIRNNQFKLNTKTKIAEIIKSDGTALTFKRHGYLNVQFFDRKAYFLDEEVYPNYLKRSFTYDKEDQLTQFSLCTWQNKCLAEIQRSETFTGDIKEVTYKTPDGRSVYYRFEPVFDEEKDPYSGMIDGLLKEVIRSDKPSVTYATEYRRVLSKYNPDYRFITLNYYFEPDRRNSRLKSISAPLGSDNTPIQKYRFDYYVPEGAGGCAAVYDALNRKTNYSFSKRERLKSIVKFDASEVPYTTENLYWGPKNTHKEVELISRTFGLFDSPYKAFSKTYGYDYAGNVVVEYLYGNLTGKSETNTLMVDANGAAIPGTSDCLIKLHEYSQDGLHLLLKTTVGTRSIRNVYLPKTNLVSACYHADAGKTYLRHFYTYDDTGMVIKHVMDDGAGESVQDLTGVTERKIEKIKRSESYPFGLPLETTELCLDIKAGAELFVGKIVNTYDSCGRILQEDIYGTDGRIALTKSKEYDAHGNIIKEIREDGALIIREYDLNDNMILEIGPNPLLTKHFSYDYMNRLIKIEEHHPDAVLSKHFRYDLCGNLIEKVDAMGTVTKTHYDEFNRPIILEGADNNRAEYAYNEMSQPIRITAADGSVTEFAYTLYGKPCKITYPDGSLERFEYDLEGRMIKSVARNGSATLQTYDPQNRVVQTIQLTASGKEAYRTHATYNAFRLLEEADAAGNVTYYSYDSFGRKTAERKGEYVTSYEYDTLNRCCKTTIDGSSKCLVLDVLNRVIEERTENLQGDVLACIQYTYDVDGNKIRIEQNSEAGMIVASYKYDTHGIPLESIDPEGNITHTRLDLNYFNSNGEHVIKTEMTDPLGIKTVIIKNTQGRIAEQLKVDSYGCEIQRTAYLYDSAGNCIRTIEAVYRGEEEAPDLINAWEYDAMNQLISSIQACGQPEEKRVTHIYNGFGQCESTIKPDGVIIQYSYDDLGRLLEEKAAHSVHYRYTYDIRSNPIHVDNLIEQTSTSRHYDEHNRITIEKLSNGLELQMLYNADGGIKKVTLPDSSSIDYTYNGTLLSSVERKNPRGTVDYKHTYNRYDLSGNPLQTALIHDLGNLTRSYTLKGQLQSQKSDYYSESLIFDCVNNVIGKSYQDSRGQESNQYTYDSLRQMQGESGYFNHQYTHDSLYNRSSKDGKQYTLNSLNSLLSDGDANYSYDACGNVKGYTKNNKSYSFTYDALDRLTTLKIDNTTYAYTYDEQNRCVAREVSGESEKILFIGQCDIGTADPTGKIKHLRVLGKGIGAEIGAAIAHEINGEVFAPLHDHQGNVVALIDKDKRIRESYRYSAFGEESIFDASGNAVGDSILENPWRFSSKRKEAEFNLFGRRFYNPDLGRWLTPDPAGHEAGPNLYAYVSNNPLSHVDHFGLSEESGWYAFAYNVCCLIWNFTKSTVKNSIEYGEVGVKMIGQGIKLAIHHCVPIPLVKDGGCMFGYFLETGSLDKYPVSFQSNKSNSYYIDGAPNRPNVRNISINGICNDEEGGHTFQRDTSTLYDGYNVYLAYNGSDGFVADILECIAQKFGIVTPSVREAIFIIRRSISEVGGVGSDGIVKIDAHSQGGIILDLALQHLTSAEKSMLCVSTYGAGTLIKPHGLRSCTNYVSTRDPIPIIGDTIGYIAACMGLRPDVKFLNPLEGGLEHKIDCKTYRAARERDAQKFKQQFF